MLRAVVSSGGFALLFACATEQVPSRPDAAFLAAARDYLDVAQVPSVAMGVEVCGYMGFNAKGDMVITPARLGRSSHCDLPPPPDGLIPVATYHTHGSFDTDYVAEVPSLLDVEGDMADGLWGIISTPGGRVWLVDPATGRSEQVCGLGCVTTDPAFVAGVDGEIADSYTRDALEAFLDGF